MAYKIWLDDVRPAPDGYDWVHSVAEAQILILGIEAIEKDKEIEVLDLDHDLGDYAKYGGDGIKLVLWLAETERFYPIKFHSMNPVGVENMRAIVERYWP